MADETPVQENPIQETDSLFVPTDEAQKSLQKPTLEVMLGFMLGVGGGMLLASSSAEPDNYFAAMTYAVSLLAGGVFSMVKGIADYESVVRFFYKRNNE